MMNATEEEIQWNLKKDKKKLENLGSTVHPQSLTWNLKMLLSKFGISFSRGLIFRWTVLNFRGVPFLLGN